MTRVWQAVRWLPPRMRTSVRWRHSLPTISFRQTQMHHISHWNCRLPRALERSNWIPLTLTTFSSPSKSNIQSCSWGNKNRSLCRRMEGCNSNLPSNFKIWAQLLKPLQNLSNQASCKVWSWSRPLRLRHLKILQKPCGQSRASWIPLNPKGIM